MNGWPKSPDFDRFESFGHDDLTAKHCCFKCSGPPDVAGLDKDFQATKHCSFLSRVHNISREGEYLTERTASSNTSKLSDLIYM